MDGDAVPGREERSPVPPAFTQDTAPFGIAAERESRMVGPFFPGESERAAPEPESAAPGTDRARQPSAGAEAPDQPPEPEPEPDDPSAAEEFIPEAMSYFVAEQGDRDVAGPERARANVPAAPGEAVEDVADRLEKLADRLRSQGPAALGAGLGRGDRFDVLLSGMLAGYLVNREE